MVRAMSADGKLYHGFEQGPIRPPSEAASLLLRLTRNCPWNRCTFCPVYKDAKFSLRPVEHILQDIDLVAEQVVLLKTHLDSTGRLDYRDLNLLGRGCDDSTQMALYAAYGWLEGGMQSVFLQDADSLVLKADDLVRILEYVRERFHNVQRITSYARSRTIDKISEQNLQRIAAAGLNRIHIGMESGADEVLCRVRKGTDQAQQIRAGLKVKAVGMELSEYVMPGLGGRDLSTEHAEQTAAALNRINPDFIRLRTLAIPRGTPLHEEWRQGRFNKLTDSEVAVELLSFLDHLKGIDSRLQSDHILNLFEEIEGQLPYDKPKMLAVIHDFMRLPDEERMLYQVGRRLGLFRRLTDLDVLEKRQRAVLACRQHGITMDNADEVLDRLMQRFI